ncbi:hypothetical protein EON63_02425 [archaeon]|nr:MAG: hypothetical protein EON63_02425 [archaeon]
MKAGNNTEDIKPIGRFTFSVLKAAKGMFGAAKALPVVGQFAEPLYKATETVLEVCENLEAYHESVVDLKTKIEVVSMHLFDGSDGLLMQVSKRPALKGKFELFVKSLVAQYTKAVDTLSEQEKEASAPEGGLVTKMVHKITQARNAEELKGKIDKLIGSIQAAEDELMNAIQVNMLDVIHEVHTIIMTTHGGIDGLLKNQTALQEIADRLGKNMTDMQREMRRMVQENAEGADAKTPTMLLSAHQLEELKAYMQGVVANSSTPSAVKEHDVSGDLAAITIASGSIVVDYSHNLGEGQFGTIYGGKYLSQAMAIKVFNKAVSFLPAQSAAALGELKKELIIHSKLSVLPGIVKLVGVDLSSMHEPKAVMELAEGESNRTTSVYQSNISSNTHISQIFL